MRSQILHALENDKVLLAQP